jgi:hypothetical protein
MATSLDIYGRADAKSALNPVANDLVAVEKRQENKQQGKSIVCGRRAYLYFFCVPITSQYRSAVLIQAHLGYLSTKRKPKAIGTLAASSSC